jgi:preprotein translocase subunit SecG|tara:strand:+ start:186 stop:497 length:312 start_codon:yes stop_codon:yes gene_type:complete
MFTSLLVVAHVVVAILLIGVVLLQRTESGMGALGGSNAVFTGKSVSNILSKATVILATLFILINLFIIRDSYQSQEPASIIEKAAQTQEVSVEEQVPALPAAK